MKHLTQRKKLQIIIVVGVFCLAIIFFTCSRTVRADTLAPIFQESFESLANIQADGGTTTPGIAIQAGKDGNGAVVNDGNTLTYPTEGRFSYQKGTLDFWFKPSWNGDDLTDEKYLFQADINSKNSLQVYINSNYLAVRFACDDPAKPLYVFSGQSDSRYKKQTNLWKTGEWHKVQVFWDFTLGDGKNYFISKIDDVYSDIKYVPEIADVSISSMAKISIGSNPFIVNGKRAQAVFDNLKIYDQSLFSVDTFTAAKNYNPWDTSSENPLRQLYVSDGFCKDFETYNDTPSDCSKLDDNVAAGESILFFEKPAFEAVYPGTIPNASEVKNTISDEAAQGQFESLFFNTYSRQNFNDVKLSFSDFTGSGGTISKDNVDFRIVKNWFQKDILPRFVPELLLYDDRVSPETDQTLTNVLVRPSLPSFGDQSVETNLTQNTSKQFIMTVHIPDGTAPGKYTSSVTLKAAGQPDRVLLLNLEVLPFALQDTGKKYLMQFSDGYESNWAKNNNLGPDYLPNTYEKMLQDIKDHGFNGIGYWNSYVANELTFKTAQSVGLKNAFWYNAGASPPDYSSDDKNLMEEYGFAPFFYTVDEAGPATESIQISRTNLVHSLGALVTTSSYIDFIRHLDLINEKIDWPMIANSNSGDTFYKYMNGLDQKDSTRPWSYYWQVEEDPKKERDLTGYHLLLTGMDGIYTGYYYYGCVDCYNEFRRSFSQSGAHYPSQQGPVPTVEWEALREGIDDGRYYATWKWYYDQAVEKNSSAASASKSVVDSVLDHYRHKNNSDERYYSLPVSQYDSDRKTLIAEILKMQAVAGPVYEADLNLDGSVNQTDLDILKADFLKLTAGLTNPKSDINADGQCTVRDAGILMSQWKP